MRKIQKQVVNDAVAQYNIAKRNGTKMDACVQAGFVRAAVLQAKDEKAHQLWKLIEATDCKAAGLKR
jgi:hypothetical protein